MSSDELARKHRLKYLVDVYFPHLKYADLHRRMAGEQPSDDARGLYRVPDELLLKLGEQWHGSYRTFATYLEPPPKPAPPDQVVAALCLVLVRDFMRSTSSDKNSSAKEDALKHALFQYVTKGERGPFAILRGVETLGQELDFQYLLPLPQNAPADSPFGVLADLQPCSAASLFLQGAPPDDWAVLRHVAIQRGCERQLLSALQRGAPLVVVTGAAGDGKTTVLKRVGMTLREMGWRVFYSNAPLRATFPKLPSLAEGDTRTALLVDNADLARGFPDLRDDIQKNSNLHVVLCSRAYNWHRKRFELGKITSIEVPPLDKSEVSKLACTIVKYGAADHKITQSEVETRIVESVASDHPHLLAAMLSATKGKSFQAIIEDMINDFEKAEEDWVLRFVACGSIMNEVSNDRLSRLPEASLLACARGRHRGDNRRRESRDEIQRQLARFSSEVIPIRAPGMTEYDLRHPDICRAILSHFYGFDGEELDSSLAFAEDLCEIGQDEIAAALPRLAQWHGRFRPYIARVAQFLLRPPRYTKHPFPPDVERTLVNILIPHLGNFPKERELKGSLLIDWASAEIIRAQDLRGDFARECKFAAHKHQMLADRRAVLETGGDGAQHPGTKTLSLKRPAAVGAVRQTFSHGRSKLIVVEKVKRHISPAEGKPEEAIAKNPLEGASTEKASIEESGKGVPKDLVDQLAEGIAERIAEKRASDFEQRAREAEAQRQRTTEAQRQRAAEEAAILESSAAADEANISALLDLIEDTERLAAELFEKALSEYPDGRNEAWIAWIKVCPVHPPEDPREVGLYYRSPAPPPTREELCRRAWSEGIRDFRLRNLWFEHELSEHNIGEANNPAPFSARWIARQNDWIEDGGQRIDPNFLNRWIDAELKDNVGSFANPTSYSARAIFRWAWNRSFRGPAFLIKWLDLEKADGNTSPETAWSVRDICRKAWAAGVRHVHFVLWWARFETEQGNVGEPLNPTTYTARWIYQDAWEDRKQDMAFVTSWLDVEEKELNVGENDNPNEYTARWIYRSAWELSDLHFSLLFRWFALERLMNNIADANSPYTASWIGDHIIRMYPSWRAKESLSVIDRKRYLDAGGTLPAYSEPDTSASLGFEPLSGPNGVADDLKKLAGVSPAMEKNLNDLGLFHYYQIATLSAEAARNLGEEIELPGCVDVWITQAKDLSESQFPDVDPDDKSAGMSE